MKRWYWVSVAIVIVICVLCGWQSAYADTVTTLGNATIFTAGTAVGAGTFDSDELSQSPPFNLVTGSNTAVNDNFSAGWTFAYTLPTGETVTGATLTIGILDSPWEGVAGNTTPANTDQVASFTLDSTLDLTGILNTEINTVGTGINKYEVDQITIPGADLTALGAGSATFMLTLQGPGNEKAFQGGKIVNLPSPSLAAGLAFSTLDIATQPTAPPVPEPATWLLFSTGILGLAIARTLLRHS